MVSNYELDDLDSINELGQKINDNFKKLFHIDNLNSNEKIYVYKVNNILVGFIHLSINYETADLLNIIVKEEYRKQNIASTLLDYAISELPRTVEHFLLEVNENNKAAIKLYNKFNFNIISIRKNYYKNQNALIMERVLK